MAIADDHTLLRHSNSLEASASGRASQTSRFEDAPPHAYAHKLVTRAEGGASTEAYPPPTGTHVDASVPTYGFAYPSLLPPPPPPPPPIAPPLSLLVQWRWLPRPSLLQPPLPSLMATTRLTQARARTGINKLVIKLVLGTLRAASLLYTPQTKPFRSANRDPSWRECCVWTLGLSSWTSG